MTTRQTHPDTEPATLDDHDELVELVEEIIEELQAEDDIMAAYLDVMRNGVPCSGVDWSAVIDEFWGE